MTALIRRFERCYWLMPAEAGGIWDAASETHPWSPKLWERSLDPRTRAKAPAHWITLPEVFRIWYAIDHSGHVDGRLPPILSPRITAKANE